MFAVRTAFMEPTDWKWDPRARHYNKVFTCSFILPMFVLGQAYSGILVSILTVPNIPTPIDSVEELLTQDKMGWAIEDGSILNQIGSTAQEGTLWARLYKDAHMVGTCYDVKERIKRGEFGQLCERMTIEKVLSDDFGQTGICNFYVATENFLATSFAMAFQVRTMHMVWLKASNVISFARDPSRKTAPTWRRSTPGSCCCCRWDSTRTGSRASCPTPPTARAWTTSSPRTAGPTSPWSSWTPADSSQSC